MIYALCALAAAAWLFALLQIWLIKITYEAALNVERGRVNDLLNRVQSTGLGEYKAFENAYPDLVTPIPNRILTDPTGLVQMPIWDDE
jgi:hypothetical protein